jgi:hypothetical protein
MWKKKKSRHQTKTQDYDPCRKEINKAIPTISLISVWRHFSDHCLGRANQAEHGSFIQVRGQ